MIGTVQERLQARRRHKESGKLAAIRYFADRREERMIVRKALKLLTRIAGDERNALELARCVAPGGVFVWPYDPQMLAIVDGKRWEGAKLQKGPDGAECMYVRANDDGTAFGDGLYFGIAVALMFGIGEGDTAYPDDDYFSPRRMRESSDRERFQNAICAAVKAHCEANDGTV